MQRRNFTNKSSWEWWWSDVDRMERVKKIEQEGPKALNNVIESCEWNEDLKLVKKNFTLIETFLKLFKSIKLMPPCWLENSIPPFSMFSPLQCTVKDVKEHTAHTLISSNQTS